MKKFAVIGNPVDHSLSPTIHQKFAQQFGIDLNYSKLLAQVDGFVTAINNFKADSGNGLNVTVPFKFKAYQLSDQRSERAAQAKAVNTLSFSSQGIIGDNTDGLGLVNDLLNNLDFEIKGKSILVLGAGGAISGVLGPILNQNPSDVVIANRTAQKAKQLAVDFSHLGSIKGGGLDQIEALEFDLVINGTAASLGNQLPDIPGELVKKSALVYDMMYSNKPTVFNTWARQSGAFNVTDGLGMLVEQAAVSFDIWHNLKPDTRIVLNYLRENIFKQAKS